MDLATLKIAIEGDSRSFDQTIETSKRKLQSFASEAGNKSKVKLMADPSGVTQGVNKAKASVTQFARTKASAQLSADASGVARGVSNAKRSLGSLPQGVDVLISVREQGAQQTSSAVQGVSNEANQLNGQAATVNVREQGSSSVTSSLRSVKTERDNLNSQGINIPWNSSAAESGAIRLGQGMRSLAIDIRALISVGSVAMFPGLIAALGTLPTLLSAAGAGVMGLVASLSGGLVGAASAAGAAMGLLGGAVGVLAAPIGILGSKFKEYEGSLNSSSGSTDAASSAASGYESALTSLSSAQQGVADAQAAADEKVAQATQAYEDSLIAVEDAERSLAQARDATLDSLSELTDAQYELNKAMRDEPLEQADAYLDLQDANLSAAEATQRQTDARIALNEAYAEGDPNEIARATLAVQRADLAAERSTISLQRASNEYYDTATEGSDNLQSALEGVESAQDGVTSSMRAEEDAQRNLDRTRTESQRKFDEIAKAQVEGQKQVDEALKRVTEAEKAVADAANKMAESQRGAEDAAVSLTAAEQALFDRFIAFKAEATEAFQPATDSLALLGVEMMDVASTYLPAVSQSSYQTAEALHRVFDEFQGLLANPNVDAGIGYILSQIPVAAELAGSAIANFGTAGIMAFSRAVPYGIELLTNIQGLAVATSEWATSAEGIAQIDAFLAGVWDTATRLGGVITDLTAGFANLFASLRDSGITDQMLGGLESMAQSFRDITTEGTASRQAIDEFFAVASPILTALGELASTAVYEFFRVAEAVGLMAGSTEGLSLMEEIIYALNDALPSFSSMFIGFVENVGPLLVELIPKFAELADIIARNSGVIENIIHLFTPFLDVFLALPAPVQDFVVQMVAAEAAMHAIAGTTLTGSLISALSGIATTFGTVRIAGWALGMEMPKLSTALWTAAKAASGFLVPAAAVAALGAIAIDFILNAPDIASAFSSTYEEARAGGQGVASSFLDAVAAGLRETYIGSVIGSAVDAGMAWLESQGVRPDVTLMDVLMGNGTLEESAEGGGIAARAITAMDAARMEVSDWLRGLVPDVSLYDVLTGDATLQDSADSGSVAARILLSLQGAYDAVIEWLGGLVPDVSLYDVLTGDATLQESADSGGIAASILVSLQGAYDTVMEWMRGLQPEVSLYDILTGEATVEEGASGGNPLLTTVSGWWTGLQEWWAALDISAMMQSFIDGFLMGLEPLLPGVTEMFNRIRDEGIMAVLSDIASQAASAVSGWVESIFGVNLDSIFTRVQSWGTTLRDQGFIAMITEIGTWLYDTLAGWIENTFGVNIDAIYARVETWLITLRDQGFIAFITEIGTWLYDTLASWIEDTFGVNIDAIYTRVETWLTTLRDQGFIAFITEIATWLYDELVRWIEEVFGVNLDAIFTRAEEWLTYLYDTVVTWITDTATWLYDELNRWVEEVFGVSLDAIIEQVTEFGTGFYNALVDGLATAVNAGIDILNGLLSAIDTVLGAINVDPIGVQIEHVSGSGATDAEHGLATSEMARGGAHGVRKTGRGGEGTHTAQDQLIRWNEQSNGPEYWIASGDPNRQRQQELAAKAARSVGLTTMPMKRGGMMYREMAVGGETDLGIEGLNARAYEIASTVNEKFGTWANTYTNHGARHYIPNTSDNTWDHWGSVGFGILDVGTGDAIWDYMYQNHSDEIDTMIWNGYGEGPGGGFEDYEHGDHLHTSIGGGGISGTFGAIAGRLMQMAQSAWTTAIEALGLDSFSMGDGALWDGVEEYIKTLPDMIWNWLLSKIPRGTGGFSGGSLSGDLMNMVNQGIAWAGWPADEAAALIELWGHESGWDPYAENPESGAYGIPQINPSSHGYPVPLGDTAGQIEWGLGYIAERYGSPSAALQHWQENNWYKRGGIVPGSGPKNIMAHGGERVLTREQTSLFGDMVGSLRKVARSDTSLGDPEIAYSERLVEETRAVRQDAHRQNERMLSEMRRMTDVLEQAMREPFDITDDAAGKIKKAQGEDDGRRGRPENTATLFRAAREATAREDNFAGRRS